MNALITPCLVERDSFLLALAIPRLRSTTSPSARSPLASTSAFLHSIIPAPVRSRSCLTNCALISAICCILLYTLWVKPPGGPKPSRARQQAITSVRRRWCSRLLPALRCPDPCAVALPVRCSSPGSPTSTARRISDRDTAYTLPPSDPQSPRLRPRPSPPRNRRWSQAIELR